MGFACRHFTSSDCVEVWWHPSGLPTRSCALFVFLYDAATKVVHTSVFTCHMNYRNMLLMRGNLDTARSGQVEHQSCQANLTYIANESHYKSQSRSVFTQSVKRAPWRPLQTTWLPFHVVSVLCQHVARHLILSCPISATVAQLHARTIFKCICSHSHYNYLERKQIIQIYSLLFRFSTNLHLNNLSVNWRGTTLFF